MKLLQLILIFEIIGAVSNSFCMEQFKKMVPQNKVHSEKLNFIMDFDHPENFDSSGSTEIFEQKRKDATTNQTLKYIVKRLTYSSGKITWQTELSRVKDPYILSTEPYQYQSLSEEDSKLIWLALKELFEAQK